MSTPNLFQPLRVGLMDLNHRVVMAPLTRFRADSEHVHTEMAVEYYRQRAATPGTLIISEATLISEKAGSYAKVPGLWNQAQIDAWKKVTDAVHAEGSYIYAQLWALGRTADPNELKKSGFDLVSASALRLDDAHPVPRPLTIEEIEEYTRDYATAAENAIKAGFDGVEVHNANGYLPDQFLQDVTNIRTDKYGGSIENRARFPLEILEAVTKAIGPEKSGIRLSPFNPFQGMQMKDPLPQFNYLTSQIAARFPKLAYVHAVESRVAGSTDVADFDSLDSIREAWGSDRVFFKAGGFKTKLAIETAEEDDKTAIVMGRYFISNPDLPVRMKLGIELEPYDRNLFYNAGEEKGYTTYTNANVEIKAKA